MNLLLLASEVPNSPAHVLQPGVPLLRTPGGGSLGYENQERNQWNRRNERKRLERERERERERESSMAGYPNPRAIEIGLIEANNLFDEVASRAEPASLSEKQRGLGIVQARPDVKYRFKVAVQPIVSCHL